MQRACVSLNGCACLCRLLRGPTEPAQPQADPEGCYCRSASGHAELRGLPVSVTEAARAQLPVVPDACSRREERPPSKPDWPAGKHS